MLLALDLERDVFQGYYWKLERHLPVLVED